MQQTPIDFVESHDDWRLLRIYAAYRVVLAFLLVSLFSINPNNPLIGASNTLLFLTTSIIYLFVAALGLILSTKLRSEPRLQAFIFIIFDIVAITFMMHANGGPTIQLSMLYLVMVAAGNILLPGKRGPLIAAVAALAVLYEQFYFILTNFA